MNEAITTVKASDNCGARPGHGLGQERFGDQSTNVSWPILTPQRGMGGDCTTAGHASQDRKLSRITSQPLTTTAAMVPIARPQGEHPSQCHHAAAIATAAPVRPFSPMALPDRPRPAWLNWLILLAFLWSSWQLAGLWLQRFHG